MAAAAVSLSRLTGFDNCGTGCWVLRDAARPDRFRLVADYCHDRFCQPCATARSHTIARNLAPEVANTCHRFVTLTLHSTDESLRYLLDHLYRSFTRLRRLEPWRTCVTGGAAFCEISWSPQNHRWHPHLHIICAGRYMPQADLATAWRKVTGTSYIVDIRLIHNHQTVLRYVTKYASKPLSSTFTHDHERLTEAILALRGRRLCLTFGTWRGVALTAISDDTDWIFVCPLSQLRREAADGSASAQAIFRQLHRSESWLPRPPPNHPICTINLTGAHLPRPAPPEQSTAPTGLG